MLELLDEVDFFAEDFWGSATALVGIVGTLLLDSILFKIEEMSSAACVVESRENAPARIIENTENMRFIE